MLLVGVFWWQSLHRLDLATGLARAQERPWLLLAALGFAGLYLVAQAVVWRRIVSELLAPLPWRRGLRLWAISNMARYLPGSLWHLVGRVVLGEAEGVGRGRGALAVVLEQALQLLSALLLVTLSLPFWPPGSAVRAWGWLAWLAPLGLVALHPRLFFPLLNAALARLGRAPLPATLRYRQMLGFLAQYLLAHLANGLALACVVLAQGAAAATVPAVVGGALFAWTVGYLTILAPGGLGVREWLVTLALAPLIGGEVAAVGALLWRAANVATEALGALGFDLLWRARGK